MDRPNDVESYGSYPKKALNGRSFVLRVCLPQKDKIIQVQNRLLMELVAHLLMWGGRAQWAGIYSFEGKIVVSPWTTRRVWDAARGGYGLPTKVASFVVCGPTLNPTFIENYTSQSLLNAINFAYQWLDWGEGPYWARVIGPDGRIILTRHEVRQMYHAEMRAAGWTITESLIQTDGSLLGKVFSERRVV
ncbi:TPA: hypothetical protein DIV48_02240 [Candidatus Kaiserbacteria bacterium]|nr:MAG: hypothetical protein UY93_C0001G0036 [Parcubacteria group bacterium GW2011_GWA1_56_13]KKW46982.1 MAG: hypothetical protein UY97_C0001G0039 [Parcubacteria group bacterium GW2011_GWB1_57_6]HCR52447.1 hypothetical protein [Candidatus Kaiserbacteria bacterium]